jgi:hypothetical protein
MANQEQLNMCASGVDGFVGCEASYVVPHCEESVLRYFELSQDVGGSAKFKGGHLEIAVWYRTTWEPGMWEVLGQGVPK